MLIHSCSSEHLYMFLLVLVYYFDTITQHLLSLSVQVIFTVAGRNNRFIHLSHTQKVKKNKL
jgi:hypothetical protein